MARIKNDVFVYFNLFFFFLRYCICPWLRFTVFASLFEYATKQKRKKNKIQNQHEELFPNETKTKITGTFSFYFYCHCVREQTSNDVK